MKFIEHTLSVNSPKKMWTILFFSFIIVTFKSNAQFINQFNRYRNSVYVSANHLGRSFNSDIGIARIDSIKKVNTEIIGFLDVLFPLNFSHFNKVAIRKGFQLNIYKKNRFSIPFIFSSTSIHRENWMENRHDITFEADFIPTLQVGNMNFSFYYGNELIAFSYIKNFKQDIGNFSKTQVASHWEKPMKYIPKIGFQFNLTLKRFTLFLKSDVERNIYYQVDNKNTSRVFFMNVVGFGFKFQEIVK